MEHLLCAELVLDDEGSKPKSATEINTIGRHSRVTVLGKPKHFREPEASQSRGARFWCLKLCFKLLAVKCLSTLGEDPATLPSSGVQGGKGLRMWTCRTPLCRTEQARCSRPSEHRPVCVRPGRPGPAWAP